jgi:hypothetical protein
MPATVLDLLACWRGQLGTRSVIVGWRIAPLCLMWIVWIERNARCFENHEKSKNELLNFLVNSLFVWTGAFNLSSLSSFLQFVEFYSFFCL